MDTRLVAEVLKLNEIMDLWAYLVLIWDLDGQQSGCYVVSLAAFNMGSVDGVSLLQ